MKQRKISAINRTVLLLCALALTAVLFVPLWRIDLTAPQYPEGLRLLIYTGKLGGNVDIINGLNHYIGMKTLHTEDFAEFVILPYIVIFFAAACALTALLGSRRLLNLLFVLFAVFGVVAMADFWRWEYDYGHNLSPDAAIIVPGMAYQPPLIGFKQLLNFGAWSVPDTGGWLFIGTGVLLLLAVVTEWRSSRRQHRITPPLMPLTLLVCALLAAGGCSTAPQPLKPGRDNCAFCKMAISDLRFGAEAITHKSKVYKFDDIRCMLAYIKAAGGTKEFAALYAADFDNSSTLLPAHEAFFYRSEKLQSPMGGNIAAFADKAAKERAAGRHPGEAVTWEEISR